MDLRLGAIDTTNVNNREGEKERQSEKSQTFLNISNILKEVRMHGKCMNMLHAKEIASWAQPNPNLSAHKHIAHI